MIDNDTPAFKVSQVAKHLNMSVDRLRTYDEEKLVLPLRDRTVRLYSNNDIEWLENLRKIIKRNKLSICGFKEILRISYLIDDNVFDKLVKNKDGNDIWEIIAQMRKNSNYEKLKKFYV